MATPLSITRSDIRTKALAVLGLAPCEFQIEACDLQLRRQHSILISPTGSGKSLTFFLPFLWDASGVTILICPLQLLGEQHASSPLLAKLRVRAINLTAATATDAVFKEIENGAYQLVIASPEYIAEDTRFLRLWRSTHFTSKVRRLLFDEAHCVSQWGDFRKAYKNLCFLRFVLPLATVLVASATLPRPVLTEVKSLLGLKDDAQVIRRSNNRPNVSLVVRPMAHTLKSLYDLAFLIPTNQTTSLPPPRKFMLFMESKDLCQRAGRFLQSRLPPELQDKVVWVHADMSRDHNLQALSRLRAGEIYGIVCTDVAGMGIDIPDVEIVVQYQLPSSMSVLWQRLGRAWRDRLGQAMGVLIVERKYFEGEKAKKRKAIESEQARKRRRIHNDLLNADISSSQPTASSLQSESSQPPISVKEEHPLVLSVKKSTQRSIKKAPSKNKLGLDIEKGLNSYINADVGEAKCRRQANNLYFENITEEESVCCERCFLRSVPASLCCDICNPKLADDLFSSMEGEKPSKVSSRGRRVRVAPNSDGDSEQDVLLRTRLREWRDATAKAKWGPYFPLGGRGIIGDPQIERVVGLARQNRGLICDVSGLKAQLKWSYHAEYGADVIRIIHDVYPEQPQPRAASKRRASTHSRATATPTAGSSSPTTPTSSSSVSSLTSTPPTVRP